MSTSPQKKGTTVWLPTKKDRDTLNKKCREGESVAQMLKRRGLI